MANNFPTPTLNWSSGGQLVNQRITPFVSLLATQGAFVSAAFTQLIAKGMTCRGSSNGVTAALDGVNRLTTAAGWAVLAANTTTAQSWGVFTDLSGTQWLFSYTGATADTMRVAKSAQSGYVIAGTATFCPTATDEEVVLPAGSTTIGSSLSGDRVFDVFVDSTHAAWWMLCFRAGVPAGFLVTGRPYTLSPDVVSPAAPLGPQVVGWFAAPASMGVFASQIANYSSIASGSVLRFTVPAGSVSIQAGGIAAVPFSVTTTDDGFIQEINGSVQSISPLGIYSSQANARGNIGLHVDMWNSKDQQACGALGGPTTGKEFVYINNGPTVLNSALLLPWDNSTAVCTTV